ncbi:MAG TPA: ABC transporter permease [Bryobacteraceae bacterium]
MGRELFWQFRLANRTIGRNKRDFLCAAGVLALGIGMSLAMFSLVDAVLLRPLPFPRQDSIQVIWKVDPLAGAHVEELAYPELGDLQQGIPEFSFVALMPTSLYGYARVLQKPRSEPIQIESAPVSHDFFKVLGVTPAMGRDFAETDEHVGAPPVVILSNRVWQENLNADPNIVGQMIRLNGRGHRVIGVMAEGVEFPRGAGMWFPVGVDEGIVNRRGATFLQAIARVKGGVSRNRIESDVNGVFKRQVQDHPGNYTSSQRAVITPLTEYWTGSARIHLWTMMAASILLLTASIISAANLLLSRTLSREYEIATRLALGATRRDIVMQLASEGTAVAAIAVAGGLALAEAVIRLMVMWAPADIPRLSQSALTAGSFCFAAGAAIFAVIGCSAIPGFNATAMNLESALREGSSRSSQSRRGNQTRGAFLLAQSAVTVVLLSMAVLLISSYRSMMFADIGFRNRDALTMNLHLRGLMPTGRSESELQLRREFYTVLLDRLRAAPGVISAAAILERPLEGPIGWDVPYEFEFEAAGGSNHGRVLPKSNFEVVTPDYFRTVGTPLLQGRDFDTHDSADAEAVAIVSRKLGERIRAAGHDPIGYRMHLGTDSQRWRKIIAVCGDARYRNITRTGTDIFVPYLQAAPATNYVAIRGSKGRGDLEALVRQTLGQMDSTQAIAGIATIGELIDRNAARHRFNMILLLWFGICSTILAMTGVYSVVTEMIVARRSEIGIRIALGSQRPRLVRDLVGRVLLFVISGEVIAVLMMSLFGSIGSDLLYGVSAGDPFLLGSAALLVLFISTLAALEPAWLASGSDAQALLRAN